MTAPRVVSVYDQDERSFISQVLDLAQWMGWRRAHFRPAMTVGGWRTPVQGDGAGFPDLILLRRSRIVVAELKSRRGRLGADQLAWLADWRETAAEVYVWRPSDWEAIRRVLAR